MPLYLTKEQYLEERGVSDGFVRAKDKKFDPADLDEAYGAYVLGLSGEARKQYLSDNPNIQALRCFRGEAEIDPATVRYRDVSVASRSQQLAISRALAAGNFVEPTGVSDMASIGRKLLEADKEGNEQVQGAAASLSEAISRPLPKPVTSPEVTSVPVSNAPMMLKKVVDPIRVVFSSEDTMAAVACEKVIPLSSIDSGDDYIGFMLYKPENGRAVEPLLSPPRLFNLMIDDKHIPGRFVILPIYNKTVCYTVVEYDFAQRS